MGACFHRHAVHEPHRYVASLRVAPDQIGFAVAVKIANRVRRQLYRLARGLGDLHSIETGRLPQRIVRRAVYRHTSKLARILCRLLGV